MEVFVFLTDFEAVEVEQLVIFAALGCLDVRRTQMNGLQVILFEQVLDTFLIGFPVLSFLIVITAFTLLGL